MDDTDHNLLDCWNAIQSISVALRDLDSNFKRNPEGRNFGFSFADVMKSFALFCLGEWERNPSLLMDCIKHKYTENNTAVYWPIVEDYIDNNIDSHNLYDMDRNFYDCFVKAGGLDKYKIYVKLIDDNQLEIKNLLSNGWTIFNEWEIFNKTIDQRLGLIIERKIIININKI